MKIGVDFRIWYADAMIDHVTYRIPFIKILKNFVSSYNMNDLHKYVSEGRDGRGGKVGREIYFVNWSSGIRDKRTNQIKYLLRSRRWGQEPALRRKTRLKSRRMRKSQKNTWGRRLDTSLPSSSQIEKIGK